VSQYHSVKIAVEFIILIGIKPFLLPGVGIDIDKLCFIAFTIIQETNLNCLEVKYHVIYVLYNLIIFLLYIQTLRFRNMNVYVFQHTYS